MARLRSVAGKASSGPAPGRTAAAASDRFGALRISPASAKSGALDGIVAGKTSTLSTAGGHAHEANVLVGNERVDLERSVRRNDGRQSWPLYPGRRELLNHAGDRAPWRR